MNTDWKQIADERSVTIRSLIKEHTVMRKQLDIAVEALEHYDKLERQVHGLDNAASNALAKIKELK